MASSASFSIFILGILLTLKCEFLSAHAPAEEDSRLSVSSLLYQMIGDVYELQNENKMMKEKIEMLESGLESLESELETSHKELRWEEWGLWGQCTAHCKDGVGDRLQSRTRNKKHPGDLEKSSQTESRPCNSVQFAGCISPQNGDQFFAVAYDYQHMLAQSTCTAMAPAGPTNAVRRACSNEGPDCNAVCEESGKTCFNALHVYYGKSYVTPLERFAVEQDSLEVYKYNGCGGQFCGPNFCCCKS